MRSPRRTLAAVGFAIALAVPAISLAAQEAEPEGPDAAPPPTLTPGNVRPDAALASSASGGTVAFDASASADSDGSIATYEWDLDGDSVYETKTGSEPRSQRDYAAGTTLIAAVRVTDDDGASDDATTAVAIAAAADEAPQPTPATAATALQPTGDLADQPQPEVRANGAAASKPRGADEESDEPEVRAAASGSVTIKDFSFAPASVTISPGDTVTWTNQGPTVHTATASDGSFDSGNLAKGRSFSRKFSSAGTFSYICKPHPFMKGKIVVAAAGGSGGSAGSSGSGSDGGSGTSGSGSDSGADAGSSASGSSSGGDSLATTGVDLAPWALFGLSLFAFGAALRFRLTD